MLVLALACVGCRAAEPPLGQLVHQRIASSGAEVVGVYYRNLTSGDSLVHDPDRRMHAASTMKVPVMIQVFRDAEAGTFGLDDSIPVRNAFRSLVDGSVFSVNPADDSDSTLYLRVGGKATVRELLELMITYSSNLATDVLMEVVGPERVTATMRELGADSIQVLRGVEDQKAYDAGLNNTTTARDLGVIMAAIHERRAAGDASCREMEAILGRQHFNEGIPAGLPPGTVVAHKTGEITRIHHDAAIVMAGDVRYVLVVLVKGLDSKDSSAAVIADLARLVHGRATRNQPGAIRGSAR
jgi:beta-lactamase class A